MQTQRFNHLRIPLLIHYSTIQLNWSIVQLFHYSSIQRFNHLMIPLFNCLTDQSTISRFNQLTIPHFQYYTIQTINRQTTRRFRKSMIQPMDHSTIQLFLQSTITVSDDSTNQPFNYSTIPLFNYSTIWRSTIPPLWWNILLLRLLVIIDFEIYCNNENDLAFHVIRELSVAHWSTLFQYLVY